MGKRILIAVDGSAQSEKAALAALQHDGELHLLNVQIPVDSGHARLFVSLDELESYYHDEGLAALAGARRVLDAAGVVYTPHVAVGHVAETIVRYATEKQFDEVIMGSSGHGALGQLLLGSVSTEVKEKSPVPVTIVS